MAGRDAPGRVVLLNGASSSGKSSIAAALARLLPGRWFVVPVDAISAMRSDGGEVAGTDLHEALRRTRLGYHRVVAALASVGNDVVMDYPLSERWRLDDLLDVLAGYHVTLVEVRCSPDVLLQRERARGDRPIGLAESQHEVYALGDRDIAVDTTSSDPASCARLIVEAMDVLAAPKAFDRLRKSRGSDVSGKKFGENKKSPVDKTDSGL